MKNIYAKKIFCAWDYGIATREAAELKSSAIYHELTELLSESLKYDVRKTLPQKIITKMVQIIANLIILGILAALGWSLWLVLQHFSNQGGDSVVMTTVVINLVMMIVPSLFSFISRKVKVNLSHFCFDLNFITDMKIIIVHELHFMLLFLELFYSDWL